MPYICKYSPPKHHPAPAVASSNIQKTEQRLVSIVLYCSGSDLAHFLKNMTCFAQSKSSIVNSAMARARGAAIHCGWDEVKIPSTRYVSNGIEWSTNHESCSFILAIFFLNSAGGSMFKLTGCTSSSNCCDLVAQGCIAQSPREAKHSENLTSSHLV